MFGWVKGAASGAVARGDVPYWQGAHSLCRLLTMRGGRIVQAPAPEVARLRTAGADGPPDFSLGGGGGGGGVRVVPGGSGYLPGFRGDALDIIATFAFGSNSSSSSSSSSSSGGVGTATAFGLSLRVGEPGGPPINVSWAPGAASLSAAVRKPGEGGGQPMSVGGVVPQPRGPGTATLRVFLDRSIVEAFSGGAALTARVFPTTPAAAVGLDAWSEGGEVTLLSVDAWRMGSMWQPLGAA